MKIKNKRYIVRDKIIKKYRCDTLKDDDQIQLDIYK